MKGVNRVTIVGHFCKAPEMRFLPSGKAVASFTVATSEQWKDTSGAKQEATEFHRCTAFDKLAEIIGQYCTKGMLVYCEGSIHTRKYQDKQTGVDKFATDIKVNQLQMLGGGEGKGEGQTSQRPAQQQSAPASTDEFIDDIPF